VTLEMVIPLFAAAVQSGTPILYATLGEILTEKSGVLNLGVEGMLMVGALTGFIVTFFTGIPLLGLFCAGLAGATLAGVHGLVCIVFQGNQVVSGLALTILGTGLADYMGTPYIGQSIGGFQKLAFPILGKIPLLGPIFFQQDLLVYFSYLIAPLLWFYFRYTKWGLSLRSTGEYPDAAIAAGVPALLFRWIGVTAGGFLVGLGGAYLSLAYTHLWANHMSAGRGWIAVALVIFAFWKPGRAVLGAYLFGGVMAFQLRLQAMGTHLPSSLLLMLPYALTVIVLVFSSWKGKDTDAPAALGVNIEPVD
jgi:ABC-type uncharacterized transport system permease subunit